jgi:transposase
MLADLEGVVEWVVGVDTHRDQHVVVVCDQAGRLVAELVVAADRAGYAEALRFVEAHAWMQRWWAVEGTGSYGAGLTRYLIGRGERVVEVERPHRRGRDGRIKDDWVDARRAALHVLAGRGSTPRHGTQTEVLRLLVRTRQSAVSARTDAVNELRAAILTAPDPLRERLSGLGWRRLVDACRQLRSDHDRDHHAAFVLVARSLARRIDRLAREADQLKQEITRHVRAQAPALLQRRGIGPIVAAQLLISWSHKGRLQSEACFARLAGVAPIPATSGQTTRHRLDRGGDRHLNQALHTIALSLARTDPATQRFIQQRISHGKTRREAIRLLKRYLARSIYRHLETMT